MADTIVIMACRTKKGEFLRCLKMLSLRLKQARYITCATQLLYLVVDDILLRVSTLFSQQ